MRKFVIAFVVILIATALLNFVIHGVLLQPLYSQTPQLMRQAGDSQSHAKFLMVGFVFFALGFVWIYSHGVESKPWVGQGVRYGLAVWLIASVSRYFIYYAIQPWSMQVVMMQISYELAASLILGIIVAAIYKSPAQNTRG